MFVVLFALSTGAHLVFGIRYRLWWMFPTIILAGSGEILGWVGRSWSTWNVTNRTPFRIQLLATILAPTPLLASIFIIFAALSQRVGTTYSRLSPRLYSRIFLTCDIVALLIQAAGGAIAATANDITGQKRGSNIMLAGIIFQTVAMAIFMTLASEYFYRYSVDRPIRRDETYLSVSQRYSSTGRPALNRKLKLVSIGLCLATLFLFIRAIYRLFELADGWNGKIISTQWYFNLFDGGMIVLCMYTLNIFHPGPFLYAVPLNSVFIGDKASVGTTESLAMVPV